MSTTLEQELRVAGAALGIVQRMRREASGELAQVIRRALAEGMTEVDVAKLAGVTRTTVRRAAGKLS